MIATEQMKCCICKIEIDNGMDYHNPTPLGKNDSDDKVTQLYGDVCCTYCNITKVLPARIAQNKDQFQEQKEELAEDLKQSRQQEYVRKEMDKIRAEGWKEESTTDTHKIIYEAEKRVAEEAKDVAVGERIKAENLSEPLKDLLKEEYNSGNVNFLKEGKFIMCSKCLDNTPHIPAWGICQRCGTQYSDKL